MKKVSLIRPAGALVVLQCTLKLCQDTTRLQRVSKSSDQGDTAIEHVLRRASSLIPFVSTDEAREKVLSTGYSQKCLLVDR
jgi:hypothetical protein